MKTLFTCSLLLLSVVTFAQRQNVYFFKNNGRRVTVRDSADYTRVVREPDSGSVYYKVLEYYLNGKPKRMGLSSTIDPIKLEGTCTSYFNTGKRRDVLNYRGGLLTNDQFYYYPNGKLKEVRNYPDLLNKNKTPYNQAYLITTFNDTTGTALVTNGTGHYVDYNKDFTKAITQGNVKNGLKDGEWNIVIGKDSILVKENYSNGKLVTGTAKFANGESYTYTLPEKLPEFNGGLQAFYKFLNKTLRYPELAYKSQIQGKVLVSFIVEKDGTLSNIRATDNNVAEVLNTEAIRVLSLSPKWNPGIQYGRPVRVTYTVPVIFKL
jgi:TonB family protein